jgi:hypothetical protein
MAGKTWKEIWEEVKQERASHKPMRVADKADKIKATAIKAAEEKEDDYAPSPAPLLAVSLPATVFFRRTPPLPVSQTALEQAAASIKKEPPKPKHTYDCRLMQLSNSSFPDPRVGWW